MGPGSTGRVGRRKRDDPAGHARFGRYFPRVFAYARSYFGSEREARNIVVEAFRSAFAFPQRLSEDEFRVVLFGVARRLCHARAADEGGDDLTDNERDVVSLVFDAQLNRDEIASLLRLDKETVALVLLRALRKLQSALPARVISGAPS